MRRRLGNSIIKMSNKFAVLENLSDSDDISRVWENIKESIINHGLMKNI